MTHALLGVYLAQSELGDYNPVDHGLTIDYIREFDFAPSQSEDLLERIIEGNKVFSGQTNRAGPQSQAAAEAGNSLLCPLEEEAVVATEATLEAVVGTEAKAVTVEVTPAKAEAAVVTVGMTVLIAEATAGTAEAARGKSEPNK